MTHPIPAAALAQHIAVLGKNGSGKTVQPNAEDCAYAAGLFDGEGFVTIASKSVRGARGLCYTMRCGVSQNDPRPLTWLRDRWGGTVTAIKRNTTSSNVTSVWMCFTRDALEFLVTVKPYLIVKRRRAHLAIKFQRAMFVPGMKGLTQEQREWQAQCKARMNVLNALKEYLH